MDQVLNIDSIYSKLIETRLARIRTPSLLICHFQLPKGELEPATALCHAIGTSFIRKFRQSSLTELVYISNLNATLQLRSFGFKGNKNYDIRNISSLRLSLYCGGA